MGKSKNRDIGISKKEYEVGIILERLFALAKANKCATCLLRHPTHVNLTRAELLCASCSSRTKNKAKIGADLISKEDLERLERVYNGSKHTVKSKHSSKKYSRQDSDNWASSFKHKKGHSRTRSSRHNHHHHRDYNSRRNSVSYSSSSTSSPSPSRFSSYSSASELSRASLGANSYSSYAYSRKSMPLGRDVSVAKSRRFDYYDEDSYDDEDDYDDEYGYGSRRYSRNHQNSRASHLKNAKSSSRHLHGHEPRSRHSSLVRASLPPPSSRSKRHHQHRDREHNSRHSPAPGKRTDARDIPGMVGIMARRPKPQTPRDAIPSVDLHAQDMPRRRQQQQPAPPPAPNHPSINGDYWPSVPPRKSQPNPSAAAKISGHGQAQAMYAALPSYVPMQPRAHLQMPAQGQIQTPGYHPTNPFSGSALAVPRAIADGPKTRGSSSNNYNNNNAFDLGPMRNALLNNGLGPVVRPHSARLQQDELARFAHLNTR